MGLSHSNIYRPKYNNKEYIKRFPGKNIYGIDDNLVYWRGEKVNGANGLFFKDLGFGYGKDNKNIFYNSNRIEIKTLSSFVVLYNGYALDDMVLYYKGNKDKRHKI
jgi:hypothetical protein